MGSTRLRDPLLARAEGQAFQSIGLVTDVEPFLRELTTCIAAHESNGANDGTASK